MVRKKLIAANWKMHKTNDDAIEFAVNFKILVKRISLVDMLICPPFTAIRDLSQIFDNTNIRVGAQNMHYENEGALTGEISASMLRNAGAGYVILGHSERRKLFKEDNKTISRKVRKALKSNLIPILCIGETLSQRNKNQARTVLKKQLAECLEHVSNKQAKNIIIAYEPIWAIGTGKNATPQQAEATHKFIRTEISRLFSKQAAATVRILYGGSANPVNSFDLLKKPNIDGLLVGGASLVPGELALIVQAASSL